MQITFLGVFPYSFPDKDTGELIEGASIQVLTEPVKPNPKDKPEHRAFGYQPVKMTIPMELVPEFRKIQPLAKATLKTSFKPDSKGKPVIVVEGVS